MNDVDEFDALRASPFTSEMDDAEVRALAAISTCRVLENEEILFHEGDTGPSLHMIIDGRLAVTRDTGGGEWTVLHVLGKGDLTGEMSFIDGRPHSATLRSLGPTKVCSFDRDRFEDLVDRNPWVVYKAMKGIITVVHDILRRMNAQYVEMSNYISKQHGRY